METKYLTLSQEISLKLHFGYFEMCILLKTAAHADYFGKQMKTSKIIIDLVAIWSCYAAI